METDGEPKIAEQLSAKAFQKNHETPSIIIPSKTQENSILNESTNPFDDNFGLSAQIPKKFGLFGELFGLFNLLQCKIDVSMGQFRMPESSIARQLNNIVDIIIEILNEFGVKNTIEQKFISQGKIIPQEAGDVVNLLLEKVAGEKMQKKVEEAVSLAKAELEQNTLERLTNLEHKLLTKMGEENRSLLVKVEEIVEEVEDSIREDYQMEEEEKISNENASEEKTEKIMKKKRIEIKVEESPDKFNLDDLVMNMNGKEILNFKISKVGICFLEYGETDHEFLVSRNKPSNEIAFYQDEKLKFCIPKVSCKDILYLRDKFWLYDDNKKVLLRQDKDDVDPTPICKVDVFGYGRDFGNILTSMLDGNIIVIRYHKKIHFVEINKNLEKGLEKKIKIKDETDEYKSVKVFGKKNDRLLILTNKGKLTINEVKIVGKSIKITKLDELQITTSFDFGYRISITENGEYAFVATGDEGDFDSKCSSITAVRILRERRLEQLSLLEIGVLDEYNFACFDVFGVFDDKVVIAAGFGCCSSKVRTFVFDTKRGEFRYLSNLTRDIGQGKCYKFAKSRAGNLAAISNGNEILTLDYNFKGMDK